MYWKNVLASIDTLQKRDAEELPTDYLTNHSPGPAQETAQAGKFKRDHDKSTRIIDDGLV
jgi:hypothetical protein